MNKLFEIVSEDWRTHGADPAEVGFWVLAIHRVGSWARTIQRPVLRRPLQAFTDALSVSAGRIAGIELAPEMKVGRRVRLWHHGCVRLAAREVGDDVQIRHATTFGPQPGTPDDPRYWPVIGARVEVGAGACILGNVQVGADAVVGANSLVVDDVAPETTMAGVPARRLLWGRR